MAKFIVNGTTEFVSESDLTVARLVRGMIERDGLEAAMGAKPACDSSQTIQLQAFPSYAVVESNDNITHVPVKPSSEPFHDDDVGLAKLKN